MKNSKNTFNATPQVMEEIETICYNTDFVMDDVDAKELATQIQNSIFVNEDEINNSFANHNKGFVEMAVSIMNEATEIIVPFLKRKYEIAVSDIQATIQCEGWDAKWEQQLKEYTDKMNSVHNYETFKWKLVQTTKTQLIQRVR